MSLKRVFNIGQEKQRLCLKCNQPINRDKLKDDVVYTCNYCGQQHFVDIYNNGSCALTVTEKPELRKRHSKFTKKEFELFTMLCSEKERANVAEAKLGMLEELSKQFSNGEITINQVRKYLGLAELKEKETNELYIKLQKTEEEVRRSVYTKASCKTV